MQPYTNININTYQPSTPQPPPPQAYPQYPSYPQQSGYPQYPQYGVQHSYNEEAILAAVLIGVCIILLAILFYPMNFYYYGEQYMLYLKNESLISSVYHDVYKESPSSVTDMIVKESWSFIDMLMLSMLYDLSFNFIWGSIFPIGVKIGNVSLFTNKDTSLEQDEPDLDEYNIVMQTINDALSHKTDSDFI